MDAFTENAHKLLKRVGAPRNSEWTEGYYSGYSNLSWSVIGESLRVHYITSVKKGEKGFGISCNTSFSVAELSCLIDIKPLAAFLMKMIQDCDFNCEKQFRAMKEVDGPKANN